MNLLFLLVRRKGGAPRSRSLCSFVAADFLQFWEILARIDKRLNGSEPGPPNERN